MGHSRTHKEFKKAKVAMVKYVDNMKIPDFYFKTAGSWHQYHSDNKSTTDEPKYLVMVWHTAMQAAFININYEPDAEGNPLSDAAIVNDLRRVFKLDP
ncbi:hypothetical protein B5807_11581 [Epicoccum nigrum]|uniref:Uncharacterized protein n=1 Tax=Epicoccum nigrum TaxID=105696 RepID=A0A1Y2LJF1_EPING|nr:hypothetical protein B5807_11581 [Epicoccum nigrum]